MVRRRQLSNHNILKIINEVKKHPCIWDRENEHFNDRYNVGLAWKITALRLHLTEEAVKVKWKTLRDIFNREIKKNPASLTKYTGNWTFFKEMLFTTKGKKLEPEANKEVEYLEIHNEEDTTELELEDEKPDEHYDLLFLESLTPYFKQLEPVRKLAMRSKIQNMLLREISIQNDDNDSQDTTDLVYINAGENSDVTDIHLL